MSCVQRERSREMGKTHDPGTRIETIMNHILGATIGLGLLCLLAACATGSEEKGKVQTAVTAPEDIAGRIGGLSPRDLSPDQCGMFLWARTSERPLVFFATGEPGSARMKLDSKEIALKRTAAEGDAVFGQYPRQNFVHEALTVNLNIKPERRSGLVGGAVVRQGILRLETAEGWGYAMPVAGLIACETP